MIIVTDSFLSDQYVTGFELMIRELIIELARSHPLDSFIILAYRQQPVIPALSPNITIHRINSCWRQLFGKWWYRYGLPRTLRKLNAGAFLCAGNLRAPTGQVSSFLFLPTLPATDNESGQKSAAVQGADRLLTAACRRSRVVISFSANGRRYLQERYPDFTNKIRELKPGVSGAVGALPHQERELVKTRYANGLEYFVFGGDLHERHLLTMLLKAFSIFKKWQQSNMQLVFAGSVTTQTAAWQQALSAYKYRTDVHVLPDPATDTLQTLIAGAYAFVYPAAAAHTPVTLLYAMQAGVPVIASPVVSVQEIAGDAVMYVAQNNETGFAAAMQAMYKEEDLCNNFARQGLQQAAASAKEMAQDCWHILEEWSKPKS